MKAIERYKKRVTQGSKTVGESLTSRTHVYINRKFKESPQYRKATVKSSEYPNISNIDIHITSIERMGGIKNVVFRPQETLGLGSYLTFDKSTWIIYDMFKNTVTTKAIVQECNTQLKWEDKDGVIHTKPCYSGASDLGSKAKQSRSEIAWNKYDVRVPSGQLFCYVELDENTRKIDIEQRLIFGDKVYKVVGYDSTTLTSLEGYGVIYFTLALTPRKETDDFESGVADNSFESNDNNDLSDGEFNTWG